MSDRKYTHEGVGGLAISSADWQKIHELETHIWAKFDEAKIDLWAIKKSIASDLVQLVKVGGGIKDAVIASAAISAVNVLVLISGALGPHARTWRRPDSGDRARGWRGNDDDRE